MLRPRLSDCCRGRHLGASARPSLLPGKITKSRLTDVPICAEHFALLQVTSVRNTASNPQLLLGMPAAQLPLECRAGLGPQPKQWEGRCWQQVGPASPVSGPGTACTWSADMNLNGAWHTLGRGIGTYTYSMHCTACCPPLHAHPSNTTECMHSCMHYTPRYACVAGIPGCSQDCAGSAACMCKRAGVLVAALPSIVSTRLGLDVALKAARPFTPGRPAGTAAGNRLMYRFVFLIDLSQMACTTTIEAASTL